MNLYLYGQETNLNDEQKIQLARTFKRVLYLDNVDYTLPIQDSEPKVIAADPDITGWDIPNNVIAQIPSTTTCHFKIWSKNPNSCLLQFPKTQTALRFLTIYQSSIKT